MYRGCSHFVCIGGRQTIKGEHCCLFSGCTRWIMYSMFTEDFLFLIILTYPASCCVTFGRKMPASSWMGIEDGTFHQILCKSDILMLAKFNSLSSSSVDLSNYKRLFQEVSHQTSMLGLAWIKLLRIMAYNLSLLLQAFVLTMVIS